MLTESFLITPTALTMPLHSYRMLAYHSDVSFKPGIQDSDARATALRPERLLQRRVWRGLRMS